MLETLKRRKFCQFTQFLLENIFGEFTLVHQNVESLAASRFQGHHRNISLNRSYVLQFCFICAPKRVVSRLFIYTARREIDENELAPYVLHVRAKMLWNIQIFVMSTQALFERCSKSNGKQFFFRSRAQNKINVVSPQH